MMLNKPAYTLMVTGEPWKRQTHKSVKPMRELTQEEKENVYEFFVSKYRFRDRQR